MLMEFQTKLLHGKAVDNYANGSTVPPVSLANAFAYESSEQLEKVFQNRAPGFAYTRIANPTVDAFERRVNELEGGIGGVACSSGMSAVTLSLLNILQAGDEVIAGSALFGGTLDLLHDLEAFGIKVHFIPRVEKALIEPFLTDKTRAVFGEIVGNPALNVMDVRETADFLHGKGVPLIVDSTTSTPYLLNPIQYGADVVGHSTSKYINGSGDAISGIIIDSGNFSWSPERYPGMKEYKKYGKFAYLVKLRNGIWRNMGGCLAPMNAYLNIIGMETLGLRMERVCNNAFRLAQALEKLEGVSVNYPLLESSPYHELAEKQLSGKGGAILTIRAGSKERAYKLINHQKYSGDSSGVYNLYPQYAGGNGRGWSVRRHNPYQCGYRRYKRFDKGFHRGSGEPWRRIIHDIHIIRRFGRNMIVTGQRRWFKNRITDRQSETREAPEVQECPVKWNSMIFRASFCSKIFSDIESVSETVSL